LVIYFFKDKFDLGIEGFSSLFWENPLVKIISLAAIGFVGFLLLRAFIKFFSKNV